MKMDYLINEKAPFNLIIIYFIIIIPALKQNYPIIQTHAPNTLTHPQKLPSSHAYTNILTHFINFYLLSIPSQKLKCSVTLQQSDNGRQV